MLSATSSPPHLMVFSTLPCLLSSSSSLPPLLPSSHLSEHSPPISALASLVSSCPPHVTLPLSSVVCHPPSFLRVLPTVVCSSPVPLSSSSALLFALATLAIFRIQFCVRTLVAYMLLSFGHCQGFRSVQACRCHITQVLVTLPFSLFEIRRSAITPSTALHVFATAYKGSISVVHVMLMTLYCVAPEVRLLKKTRRVEKCY